MAMAMAIALEVNSELSELKTQDSVNLLEQQRSQHEIEKEIEKLSCNDLMTDVEKKFDFIRFTVADIHGIGRCRIVPSKYFADLAKDKVQLFCGVAAFGPRSEYVAHKEILTFRHGNVVLRPFIETLVPLPWATSGEFRIGEVICETFWGPSYNKKNLKNDQKLASDAVAKDKLTNSLDVKTEKEAKAENTIENSVEIKSGQEAALKVDQSSKDNENLVPQEACPRYVVRRLLQRLEEEFGFKLYSSFEAEFTSYKQGTLEPVFQDNDVVCSHVTSEFESYLGRLYKGLNSAGVEIEAFQTEYEAGQFELIMRPSIGITSADGMFRLKHSVKEMSRQQGIEATFMTKPYYATKSSGTGLHFNHSLLHKITKENVMYDLRDGDNMSDEMRWWLAGLIKHSPAMTALCCPTYNCYRRLHVEPAPGKIRWGHDDRFCSYRVKAVRGPPAYAYVESRLPSGSANPYLVMAATLAAGMSGLRQRLDCPQENSPDALDLPKTLEEALTCLENDKILVEALGEGFVNWFVKVKREIEIVKLKDNRIELEREMYMKLL